MAGLFCAGSRAAPRADDLRQCDYGADWRCCGQLPHNRAGTSGATTAPNTFAAIARENDSWMLLSPHSIEWVESGCRASPIRKLTPNLYDVHYYCEGEGEKWKVRTQFLYSNGDTLRMDEMR